MRNHIQNNNLNKWKILTKLGAALLYTLILVNTGLCAGPLSIYLPSNKPDTTLMLYGPDDMTRVIGRNDDEYTGSPFSLLTSDLKASSVYYACVFLPENYEMEAPEYYSITVTGPGGIPISSHPQYIEELIVNGNPSEGKFVTRDDEHWYLFQTAQAGEYTIKTQVNLNHHQAGIPKTWKQFPVTYNLDQGSLGDMDEETISNLVRNNIEIWNQVPTSSVKVMEGSRLDFDFGISMASISPRCRHRLFYDPNRQTIVLFGGFDWNITYGDMWEWNGEGWTSIPFEEGPPARDSFGLAYDKERENWVLFGGYGVNDLLNDTWIWDGETWTDVTPKINPEPRCSISMAYDEERKEIVLFGGETETEYLRDTWIWDGESWRDATPTSPPDARSGHRLFYDPSRKMVLLFGGEDQIYVYSDFWQWNGSRWTQVPLFGSSRPPACSRFDVTYDSERNLFLLFGGYGVDGLLNDLWSWNGSKWVKKQSNPDIPARVSPAIAFDEVRNCTVLYGGQTAEEMLGDTWTWDGTNWTEMESNDDSFINLRERLFDEGINPVVFDEHGDLIDLFEGEGAKETTLGFASNRYEKDEITAGWLFLNGWSIEQEDELQITELTHTIAHEFGHFLGLTHSQLNEHIETDGYGEDDIYVPLMYPFSADMYEGGVILHHDDHVSLSSLYPSEDGTFERNFGAITGQAVFTDGRPVLGGIVAARLIGDRLGTAVTVMTDELETYTGDFRLPGLPPGEYEVWIEPVKRFHTEGSDVGVHSSYPGCAAFTDPPRSQFYNENVSLSEYRGSRLSLVEVRAGEDTPIEFICDLLDTEQDRDRERHSHIMAIGSPLRAAIGSKNRSPFLYPFSVKVDESIEDLTITVTPDGPQSMGLRVDFGDQIIFGTPDPEPRRNFALVYDQERQKTCLFGGWVSDHMMNDTWEWDGERWTLLRQTTFPFARSTHAMAYDSIQKKTILFGGHDDDYTFHCDTWEWDGAQWAELIPSTSPTARIAHQMAFDSQRGAVVLFGGVDSDDFNLNDTWNGKIDNGDPSLHPTRQRPVSAIKWSMTPPVEKLSSSAAVKTMTSSLMTHGSTMTGDGEKSLLESALPRGNITVWPMIPSGNVSFSSVDSQTKNNWTICGNGMVDNGLN